MKFLVVASTFLAASGVVRSEPRSNVHAHHKVTERIAIFSAYGPELDLLVKNTKHVSKMTLNGRTVTLGVLEGKNVLLTKTGESMVNAAMAAEAVLRTFKVRDILFSGVAGGVDPGLNIGDVVVPAQWAEFLEGYYARDVNGTFPEPELSAIYQPFFNSKGHNYDMFFPQSVPLANIKNTGTQADKETQVSWMKTDSKLLSHASKLNVTLQHCGTNIFTNTTNVCLNVPPRVVVGGNGVSGASYVDNADFRSYIFKNWGAQSVDMESAALAHVATVHNVPFIVFRSLSDLAGGSSEANEFGVFAGLAATNAADVLLAFLKKL
ncbi:nucleoside phosphorylase domain-containing protein [Chytriomyces sp. MP71]|nr:nucleoside phosphorylase domain-containing protein [Chytriomyces sp. MP71]